MLSPCGVIADLSSLAFVRLVGVRRHRLQGFG